jgi:hypothetical protein
MNVSLDLASSSRIEVGHLTYLVGNLFAGLVK